MVNIAPVSASRAGGSSIQYGVSKAALVQLTRGLARALGPQVRVGAVSPRHRGDPVADRPPRRGGFAALAGGEREVSLLGRTAQPEHVAQAVLALLAADLVTGQELVVDGGRGLVH